MIYSPFQDVDFFSFNDIEHSVFKKGNGPGVLLMHELPGMTPEFWRLANWLASDFTVWAPDLFGNSHNHTQPSNMKNTFRACISREIHMFQNNDPGPITQWLRALGTKLHTETTNETGQSYPGIGVIGMCMTGNFSLTLALDPHVTAPVTSQPALPALKMDGLQMTESEKQTLTERDVDVMGLRFAGDALCKAARFDAIRNVIGADRFQEHILPDDARNPDGPLKHPHSVLTADLVNEDDSLTKQKLGEVIMFLKKRIS